MADPALTLTETAEPRPTATRAPTQPHFMLVPSLACPARCRYCFGPHTGPVMTSALMAAAVECIIAIAREVPARKARVTFHGGEPLVAGHAVIRQALADLSAGLGRAHFALQSNLWLLDDEFCRLFAEYHVEVGTSLDGPEAITDAQRGEGYFQRTMAGIRRAQAHGLQVGCIATFTPASAPRWREVFDFFLAERLNFSLHPAVPPLEPRPFPDGLTPAEYGRLLCTMADHYIAHRREIAISSLDQVCQALGCGEGKVCTFRDCLGMFLALAPDGGLYACQRFAGRPEWRLGTLADRSSLAALLASPVARRLAAREAAVATACTGCAHLAYCRGGCPYNAWAGGVHDRVRDPCCPAYLELFDHLQTRLSAEMAAPANLDAVAAKPWDGRGHPLLKRGALIELVREGPHPRQVARTAKRIVAAVELARGPDLPTVAARLVTMGIARTQESGEASLAGLQRALHPPTRWLNNLYVHLTFRCQLECRHCYARADAHGNQSADLPIPALTTLLRDAKDLGFRQVVLTGGEPLIHRERVALLAALTAARQWAPPMNLVLRTNLALPFTREELAAIARAVDQVVASVDGDEAAHDARRGPGSHAAVVRNLEAYQAGAAAIPGAGELSLAAVLRAADAAGTAGDAVRALAQRLDVRRTRFRPLLPLGRAADWDEPPSSEALGAHQEPLELIEGGFQPVASCGLGQNLYVEPSGESFPCYAFHRPPSYLGNVLVQGLAAVVNNGRFKDLCQHHVDANAKCRHCDLRYLCGGACRAWGGEATQHDLDAPPPECAGLRARAEGLLAAASEYLVDGYKRRKKG